MWRVRGGGTVRRHVRGVGLGARGRELGVAGGVQGWCWGDCWEVAGMGAEGRGQRRVGVCGEGRGERECRVGGGCVGGVRVSAGRSGGEIILIKGRCQLAYGHFYSSVADLLKLCSRRVSTMCVLAMSSLVVNYPLLLFLAIPVLYFVFACVCNIALGVPILCLLLLCALPLWPYQVLCTLS